MKPWLELWDESPYTPQQKKPALTLAQQMVEATTNPEDVRRRALDVVGECDPNAKAFAAQFTNDEAWEVKNAAEQIVGADAKL